MKNIVLIGMPGAGKTTHGKAIANRFGLEFVDTDQMVEAAEGMPCNKVFETKGETAFREIERRMVVEASREESGRVISTGGGAVLSADNAAALKKTGMVIFINRRIKIMSREFVARRPILRGEGALKRVAAKRMPIYHKIADYELRYDIRRRAQSIVASLRPISEYAVIGDPIMHSLSPQLHSDLDYQKIWVKEKFLPDFVAAFRESKIL
jgi:shikimate kinase